MLKERSNKLLFFKIYFVMMIQNKLFKCMSEKWGGES